MSRYSEPNHAKGVQGSVVEDPVGERDPIRSIDSISISKLKVVLNGEVIYDYDYGGEEE
jgi:hypothetical protein